LRALSEDAINDHIGPYLPPRDGMERKFRGPSIRYGITQEAEQSASSNAIGSSPGGPTTSHRNHGLMSLRPRDHSPLVHPMAGCVDGEFRGQLGRRHQDRVLVGRIHIVMRELPAVHRQASACP